MAGTNILVRQKDLIAGSGISITPDTTSGNVTIAATNTAIDEARLLPTGGKNGNILEYQEGADRGNGNDVRLLLQSALTDSASGNAAPAAVTTQGVTLTGDNSLLFSGNDSHVTAVLATDEIFAADKEWTIDFWMKPIANSSEWNYILTENTGDWGSHSIGLTWNKSKSVLEQDTGGYVASVIKAPNWPNNSIACAVGEWHFVAVEKQKTATGWSLNYYLNGAIWLQVAFTGEFVPFTSDNPFWFGGKTTDSGRWFKGEANKLRVTAGARYGGKAFAVPDRLIDYAAPAGQPVWIEGIDRSRLLPENPASGDIPCYNATATTGGGNDVNTKVLLHFDELPFFDIAAGNASPAAVTNSGITLDTENFRFGTASARFAGGSNNLKVAVPQAQMMALPWLVDCWFKVDGGQWGDYLRIFTQDDEQNGGWTYYLMSGNRVGVWVRNVTPDEPTSAALTPDDWHYATLVYYNAKFYGFVDGVRFTVQDGSTEGFLNYIMLGKRIQSTSYSLRGNIDEFRLQLLDESEISKWIGATIPVPAAPYSKPQTVGEWGKLNKNELVQSVNGVAPDESGNVTVETGGAVDESRLLPETGSVSSDSVGNPVIFKAISRIDNTYWLCLPLNEDTNDRSTYDVATGVYGTVNIVSNAPSSPGGSAFFNGSSCLHGTLPAQFGTSDFTVRFWMMAPTISSSSQTIFSTRYGDQTDASTFALLSTTEGRLFIYSNGDITSRTDTPFTLQPSVWYHVAVVRKSGVLTIYVNGEVYNSATFTNSLTRQIFGLGASWTGSSYSEAGTVYLTSLDVLNYAAYDGAFTTPAYQPGILAGAGYEVATDSEFKDMLSAAGIDESRLLPELATIPEELSGHPVVFDYQSGIDADTLCLLHLDDTSWSDATGKNTVTQNGSVAKVSANGYFDNALDLSANLNSGSLSWLTIPWLAEYEAATWTMEFFAKPTKSVVNFMFFSFGDSQGSYLSLGSQNLTNLWLGNGSGTYTGNFSFSLNTWYWFVIQYDGSAVKVYVDGQLVVQGNFTPNYVGQDLQFGNLNLVNNQDNTFIGYLDEFRWSKGLRYPTGVMTAPTEPYGTPAKRYKVSEASLVFSDSTRLLPENPANGDIPCFDATATIGGGNDANTKILLHFDADEIKDEAAGNASPAPAAKKAGTITIVDGGKFDKCAQFVTGSMTVATNLDELNANNWVVSGWFNPDENNHGVSYPVWLSMDDQNTHGFFFDSTGRYGESDGPLFYMDTPPASGTWHWLAIVKYSGGLRFYLNGAFLNEISAQQRANFCSTLAIGGFAGTYAAGSTERTFSGLVDEVRLQYIPDDEITQWTGTSIAVPDAPYSKPQTVGEWGKFNKSELKATRVRILSRDPNTRLAVVQPLRLRNGVWETDPDAPEKTVKY